MTLLIWFHQVHYRDFKAFYLNHVCVQLRDAFPGLVSYQRFVGLITKLRANMKNQLFSLTDKLLRKRAIIEVLSTNSKIFHRLNTPDTAVRSILPSIS